jgi:lysophospholipase L1-like esterase
MSHQLVRAVLAGSAALSLVTACSGSGGGRAVTPLVQVGTTATASVRLVGVGDSLTAGEQSGGILGATIAPNPVAGSLFPAVPSTQNNGFWALLWAQANPGASLLNPATSPLPLMASPGVGQILVPAANGAPTPIVAACTGQLAADFQLSTALAARLNASTTPLDVAVPGQTVHEALYQIAPESPCQLPATLPNGQPNPFYGLAQLVNSESESFYPILGNFGSGLTQVQAAVALKPQIVTVWLGSNDLLKYVFSGGAVGPTDPSSFYNDTVSIIRQLQAAGAKVAVANLVDVLGAAYFTSQTGLTAIIVAQLTAQHVPLATAQGIAASYVTQIAAQGVGPNGYLTLSGLFHVLQALAASQPVTLAAGDVVPDAFAAQVQSLNDQYNAQIKSAAAATGAALVDINTTFKQIRAAGGLPVNASCCSLLYGGGFFSLDGIHPSNTGYAVLANLFIGTIDTAFNQTIPQVNPAAIYAADPFAPAQ